MKRYLVNFLGFILVLLLFGVTLEAIVNGLPSEFSAKSTYLNNNKENIEVLFLGSSHTQKAVNPDYLEHKSINLAHVGQSLDTDLFFVKKMTEELKHLKFVIIELSYHILEEKSDGKEHWRNHLYLKYYDINKFERQTFFIDKSLIYANPKFFLRQIILKERNQKFNQYGYNLNDVNIFKSLNYNSLLIQRTAAERLKSRHREENALVFDENFNRLNAIIEHCKLNDINLIVQIPPVFNTYRDKMIVNKKSRRDSVLAFFKSKLIPVLNHEQENFDIKLFSDDHHLNELGAQKYSQMLNREIKILNAL